MAQPIITDGLISYYSLDGNVKDYYGNYNGEWVGNEQYDTGKFGKAAKFDGKSQIIVTPKLNENISISMWIYNTQSDPNTRTGAFATGDIEKNTTIRLNFFDGDVVYQNGIDGNTDIHFDKTKNWINKWMHIVAMIDNKKIILYVNGKKVVDSQTKYNFNHKNKIHIGYSQWYFNGLIDEVYIFNRALSEDEIKKLKNSYTNENIKITQIETSPNINLKTSGVFYSDLIYTDYEKEINKNNTIKLENSKYKFADIFITGTNLKIDNIDYGDGLKYFLGKSVGETINISGDIKENIIVYHNGYWDNLEDKSENKKFDINNYKSPVDYDKNYDRYVMVIDEEPYFEFSANIDKSNIAKNKNDFMNKFKIDFTIIKKDLNYLYDKFEETLYPNKCSLNYYIFYPYTDVATNYVEKSDKNHLFVKVVSANYCTAEGSKYDPVTFLSIRDGYLTQWHSKCINCGSSFSENNNKNFVTWMNKIIKPKTIKYYKIYSKN